MMRVNGFFGHVKRNDLRSVAMFTGFLIAYQLLAAVILTLPLFFFDFERAPPVAPLEYLRLYGPVVLALSAALFTVRFARHLATVRAEVDFVEVDRRTCPRLVGIVERQAITAGLPTPRVGVIETNARNAFACGISRHSAIVVATRGLVEALDDDELSAVVAHELAHIRNGDIRLVAASNVLLDDLNWLERWNLLRLRGNKKILLVVVVLPFLLIPALLAGLVSGTALTIARVSRLLISSSREFVADAEAVRMTHNPGALISALRLIEGRSGVAGLTPGVDAMMIDGAVEGAFASHPTIAERVAVLTRLSGSMVQASAFRRDTRPMETIMAHRATFGRRGAPVAATAPARTIVGRANAGSSTNLFGLTRKGVVMLIAAFVGYKLLTMAMWYQAERALAPHRIKDEPVAQLQGRAAATSPQAGGFSHQLRPTFTTIPH